ncbi:MAG: extracellular solute-binding protein [Devosia nanyangense]|uniref:Extracellular solute-binding protein n=1 Tax=Devosia nanyangense TaxID=1228055 RepID=A0A933NX15_9HYPH|nr:extracellular solute-binding protein [Devosia nanyangense]
MKLTKAILLGALFAVGGAALPAQAATTLEYWTWNNEGDYVKVDAAAVQRFEAAHPDVAVEVTYVPYADYMTKLKAALAAGQPPAIFQVPWDSGFRDLAASGKLAPMSGVLANGFPAINQSAKDFVTLDGEIWALPLDLNTLQIAYNKDAFAKLGLAPPTTTDELKAVANALNDAGTFGIALGTKDKWAGGDTWFAQLTYTDPTGRKLPDADAGTVKWDDAAFTAAGDRVADLVAAGVFAPGANSMGAFNESLDLFVSGASAMFYPVGNFISGGINDKVAGAFQWDLFPFPGDAGTTPTPTGGIARMFALPAGGASNDAAADFLRTLTDEDGAATLMQYNFIPSWPVDVPADASPLYKNFLAAQTNARSRTIYTPPVNAALLDGMQAIFDGRGRGAELTDALAAAH